MGGGNQALVQPQRHPDLLDRLREIGPERAAERRASCGKAPGRSHRDRSHLGLREGARESRAPKGSRSDDRPRRFRRGPCFDRLLARARLRPDQARWGLGNRGSARRRRQEIAPGGYRPLRDPRRGEYCRACRKRRSLKTRDRARLHRRARLLARRAGRSGEAQLSYPRGCASAKPASSLAPALQPTLEHLGVRVSSA